MKGINRFVITAILISAHNVYADVKPSDLVKVTGQSEQKCVEYYSYKGESYCSTKPLHSRAVDPKIKEYETQNIVFDSRPWQAVWGKKTDHDVMVEYVPLGDDINNWSELVTSQYFHGIQDKTTLKEFADSIISGMKESGYKPDVTFYRIRPDEVVFEFVIDEPPSQVQDEVQILRKGKTGIYVLHYVIKKSEMGTTRRDTWLRNLLDSSIK